MTKNYGNHGYKLTFTNNYNFGRDTSGLSNNFIATNFTTGSSVLDSPHQDFLILDSNKRGLGISLVDGNLMAATTASGLEGVAGHFPVTSGRWYVREFFVASADNNTGFTTAVGLAKETVDYGGTLAHGPD